MTVRQAAPWCALIVSAIALGARAARADEAATALAEQLYDDAKAAMARKDYATACRKFSESNRIDPATGGTLLNLAVCHERAGKIATAWGEFEQAAQLARHFARPDRETVALQHADKLRPLVSVATLVVPAAVASVEGLRVTLDGVQLNPAAWDAIPLDPGDHDVRVEAPGKRAWTSRLTIGPSAERPSVPVPELVEERASPPASAPALATATRDEVSPAPPAPRSASHGPRWAAGYVAAGAGASAIVAGSVFGVTALELTAASKRDCSPPTGSRAACGTNVEGQHALIDANVANVAIGAGIAALGIGAYLVLTSPPAVSLTPSATSSPPVRKTLAVATEFSDRAGWVGIGAAW